MPVWAVVAVVAALGALTVYMKQKMKAAMGQKAGLFVNKTALSSGVRIVYGERRVGALIAWKDVSLNGHQIPLNQTSSHCDSYKLAPQEHFYSQLVESGPDFLHRLDVWCLGEIDSITKFQIDGDSADDYRFALKRAPYRMLNKHGGPNQTAFSTLVSGFNEINTNFKGNDIAYSTSRFWMPNKGDRQFQGEPELTAHIKGKKIFDPRLGTDTSVKAWSANPALILLDYLTASYGKNLSYSDIALQTFKDAADYCDATVTVPANATFTAQDAANTPTTYNPLVGTAYTVVAGDTPPWQRPSQGVSTIQKRFECNIVIEPKDGILENVEKILSTMKASLIFSQGLYKLNIESPKTSVMSFDESNMNSDITLGWAAREKRFNRVTVKFDNRNKEYTEDTVSFPKTNSTEHQGFLTQDNNEDLHTEVELKGVVDWYQALDAAEFLVRESRNQNFITFVAQPLAMALEPGDVIDVTSSSLNLSAEKYRVREIEVMSNLTCKVKAQIYDAATYVWDQTVAEPIVFRTPTNLFASPSAMTGLTITSAADVNFDGTATRKLTVSWTDIDTGTYGSPVDRIHIEYKLSTESAYTSVICDKGSTSTVLSGTTDVVTYDVRARFINTIGNYSPYAATTHTVASLATTIDAYDQTARNDSAAAVGTANSALGVAASANGTAQAAANTANNVSGVANSANSTANSANSTANAANSTANAASTAANAASNAAAAAQTSANNAATAAQTAINDLATVSTDLGTAESVLSALGISTSASIATLNGDVVAAQTAGDTGIADAASAAAIAANGVSDAATAQQAAGAAQGTANSALGIANTAANDAGTALQGVQQHTSDISALNQQYGITVTSQGYVSGFSLLNNGNQSEFNIVADKFNIYNGVSLKQVFGVSGSDVIMQNLRVGTAVIDNLAITTGKIEDEGVTKFDASTTNTTVQVGPSATSTLVSVSVTPTANGTIYVTGGAFVLASSAAGTTGAMASGFTVRLLKNNANQRVINNCYAQGLTTQFMQLDSEHAVYANNTYTYAFQISGNGYLSGSAAYTLAVNASVSYLLRYK